MRLWTPLPRLSLELARARFDRPLPFAFRAKRTGEFIRQMVSRQETDLRSLLDSRGYASRCKSFGDERLLLERACCQTLDQPPLHERKENERRDYSQGRYSAYLAPAYEE